MTEISEMLKELAAPWQRKEIKWRVGSTNKDKTKALPLAYIDARTVMERLDSVVGVAGWQDRYEFHGTRTVCYLSIKIGEEWITKSDGAGDSDIEGEKGGISDAFKRAAVKWGMGRELYELKCKWMPINEYKQLVGNAWDYVIKTAEPKESKRPEAESYVKDYLLKLEQCKTFDDMEALTTSHQKKLLRIHVGYEDLSNAINQATQNKQKEM